MKKYSEVVRDPLDKIAVGVDMIADAVADTIGPSGRNALLDMGINKPPKSTRDGVTVANHVLPQDRLQSQGALVIRDAAYKTNQEAGDGTSTATVLARAIFKEGRKHVSAGHNPVEVKRSIEAAVCQLTGKLQEISKPVSDIKAVASISANNDEKLGGIIAEAVDKVGKDGTIIVEDSRNGKTYLDFQKGMKIERGWSDSSHHFITNKARQTIEFDKPQFVVIDDKIHTFEQLLPVMNHVFDTKCSIVFVVQDIEDSVILFLAQNKLQKGYQIAILKTPGYNNPELVEDFADRIGARRFDSDLHPINTFKSEDLGSAKRVVIGAIDSTIIEGRGDITQRLSELNEQIEAAETEYEKSKYRDRVNRLTSAVATMHIAGNSETEVHDAKLRIEDAIHATRAAVEEGIVVGGGMACYRLKFKEPATIGEKILNVALEAPVRAIIGNTGKNPDLYLGQLTDDVETGYNAKLDKMENLIESGVIDPVKVTRTALTKAASCAGMLLCTGSSVYLSDIKE